MSILYESSDESPEEAIDIKNVKKRLKFLEYMLMKYLNGGEIKKGKKNISLDNDS